MSTFEKAQIIWKNFLNHKILEYGFKRNYDYGPDKQSAVSKISPFVSHRILFEFKLIKEIINKYESSAVNKYIEELYWRIYWKGWLENNPCLWEHFVSIKTQDFDEDLYQKALDAETHLTYFNSWIKELKEFNYLHNHTRMWFASTWIFNLGLPWELGAKLFFEHLYDGDAASNLLSWRWVAGLHTKGKRYFFTPDNLRKFSNNRFFVRSINNKDIKLKDQFHIFSSEDIFNSDMNQKSDELLIFENDLHINSLRDFLKKYKSVYLILLGNKDRNITLSKNVMHFKKRIIMEFIQVFPQIKFLTSNEFLLFSDKNKRFDLLYPSVGENYHFIKKNKIKKGLTIHNLVREPDIFAWHYAKKGFFKFKKNIPIINEFIKDIKI